MAVRKEVERNNGDDSIAGHFNSEGRYERFVIEKIWAQFIFYYCMCLGGDLSFVLVNPKDANSCSKSYLQVILYHFLSSHLT